MSFFGDDIDPAVDRALKEVATRDSYYLFVEVFSRLRDDAFNRVCNSAPTHDALLQSWAYCKVIRDLEGKMKHEKDQLKKDTPITVSM